MSGPYAILREAARHAREVEAAHGLKAPIVLRIIETGVMVQVGEGFYTEARVVTWFRLARAAEGNNPLFEAIDAAAAAFSTRKAYFAQTFAAGPAPVPAGQDADLRLARPEGEEDALGQFLACIAMSRGVPGIGR